MMSITPHFFSLGNDGLISQLRRVTLSLILDELHVSREGGFTPSSELQAYLAGSGKTLALSAFQMDSLERLSVAMRISAFFDVKSTGMEDFLLTASTIDALVDILIKARQICDETLYFQTSGTTGTAKQCPHSLAALRQEAIGWMEVMPAPKRIISMVQPHHLYGFIWSVAIPVLFNVPVIERAWLRYGVNLHDDAGDLAIGPEDWLIATPAQLRYMKDLSALPTDATIISSSAALERGQIEALRNYGCQRLYDIYGCSEFGGLGWRDALKETYFNTRPGLSCTSDIILTNNMTGQRFELLDHILRVSNHHFALQTRKDGGIQIGGNNVFPDQIRARLLGLPCIKDCALEVTRIDNQLSEPRLRLVIVPTSDLSINEAEKEVKRWCDIHLSLHERPASIMFSNALAQTDLVKGELYYGTNTHH